VVLVAVAVWGMAITLFGVLDERAFPLALLLLAVANGADAVRAPSSAARSCSWGSRTSSGAG